MILQHKNGLSFYQFPDFNQHRALFHGIFTREAGFSSPPFDSLNIGLNVGDNEKCVHQNRLAVMKCADSIRPVFVRQVHETTVIKIDTRFIKHTDSPDTPPEGDAMVTNISGIMPVIQVADCQPVFLFDPCRNVVANIHSGWRGSIQNIIGRTIACMNREYGSEPSDLIAGVGPSLGPCCAEFRNYRTEIPEQFWKYKTDNCYFDFWSISRDQLAAAKVLPEHIHMSEICTFCRNDLFYSYRKEGITGRFAAVIGLAPET